MLNLKPVYDAAKAADAKVQSVMADMIAAFEEGTEEGKQKAMDLRAALEEAKEEAKAANELYVSMRDTAAEADENARKFVPVSESAKAAEGKKTITRAEYEALDHAARHQFLMEDGGTVVDELPEE